eukprot:1156941-Pelagomonas_calceolata.AAC.1
MDVGHACEQPQKERKKQRKTTLAKSGRVHQGKVTCPERQGPATQTKRKPQNKVRCPQAREFGSPNVLRQAHRIECIAREAQHWFWNKKSNGGNLVAICLRNLWCMIKTSVMKDCLQVPRAECVFEPSELVTIKSTSHCEHALPAVLVFAYLAASKSQGRSSRRKRRVVKVFNCPATLTPRVTQQSRHLREDQRSHPRHRALPTECKPAHVHLIEIKYRYCEDTRPGQWLGAAQ